MKRCHHLRAIAHQRQIDSWQYGARAPEVGEGESSNGEESATHCDLSENELDGFEVEDESVNEVAAQTGILGIL